jgi:hypothetical protein
MICITEILINIFKYHHYNRLNIKLTCRLFNVVCNEIKDDEVLVEFVVLNRFLTSYCCELKTLYAHELRFISLKKYLKYKDKLLESKQCDNECGLRCPNYKIEMRIFNNEIFVNEVKQKGCEKYSYTKHHIYLGMFYSDEETQGFKFNKINIMQ